MNREIKFRAWNGALNHMVTPDLFNDWEDFFILPDGSVQQSYENNRNTYEPYRTLRSLPHYILMQYTGLKDKNGKEIYEGDVVKQTGNEKMFGEVVFDKSDSAFRHIHRGISNKDFNTGEMCPLHSVEIIGNIYENPSLIP